MHRARLQARGASVFFRHWEGHQALGSPSDIGHTQVRGAQSGIGKTSGSTCDLESGERLLAWALSSGTGSFLRHAARLQAPGSPVPFRQGEHMCLSTRGSPSCTVNSRRHRDALMHGVHPQRCLCIAGTGSAFRHWECIQAQVEPSGMVSGFRNWRLCARSTESEEAAWDSVTPSLSVLPLQFLQSLGVPTSGTGSEDFRHWE